MSAERDYNRYRHEYIDGSTARQLSPAPGYERRRRREQDEYDRHQRELERKRRRRLERTRGIDLFFTGVLSVAICATLYVCIGYLTMNEGVTKMDKNIAQMKSEIVTLKNQNSAIEDEKDTTIDLSEVYRIAKDELGMVLPSGNQVIPYESGVDGYVRQYSDIPRTSNK